MRYTGVEPSPRPAGWKHARRKRAFWAWAFVAVLALQTAPAAAADGVLLDSDRDGLPDVIEDPNRDGIVQPGETDPFHADTDRDGLPDGVEDRNRDGTVSPGETDPRLKDSDRDGVGDGLEVIVSGTDPNVADIGALEGRFALLPEPMFFDLVRGLAARKGELEVNSLFSGHPGEPLHWAPEIEYAVADGMALEVELPMVAGEVEAIKSAAQTRLPLPPNETFIHGAQGIVETRISDGHTDATLLWVIAAAPDRRFSFLGMFGTRVPIGSGGAAPELLVNPSAFVRLSPRWVAGAEANAAVAPDGERRLRLLPQVHWEPINHLRLQLAAGVDVDRGRVQPQIAGRIVLEL